MLRFIFKFRKELKLSIIERGLRWDERFNRRLGVLATGAAVGLAAIGAPVAATYAALFAGGNFAAAEFEKRLVEPMTNRHLGKTVVNKADLALAA